MSQANSREVATRVFARELNASTHEFKESDDDRAPQYVLLPSGDKANRVLIMGVVTETADVGTDEEYWQARINDSSGTVFVYAGQYQPDVAHTIQELQTPIWAAVVGKPRTYETDEGDVNVSIRPENLVTVSPDDRISWAIETAEQTLDRVEDYNPDLGRYDGMADEEYDINPEEYRAVVHEVFEQLNIQCDTDLTLPDDAGRTNDEADASDESEVEAAASNPN